MKIQNWKKEGIVFNCSNYAAVPTILQISEDIFRIFFSARNDSNFSYPMSIDYDLKERKVLLVHKIDLDFGLPGTFDENGIMPTCLIKKDNQLYLYYIGWNLSKTVPFRNSLGLLISDDNGLTFRKFSSGPILDRSIHDPCFVASACVLEDNGIFKMCYLSCIKWYKIADKWSHKYHIKYAESNDAINWDRKGQIAIDFKSEKEYAISTPRVVLENKVFKMWYSYRGSEFSDTYRIGYAESRDCKNWTRMDEKVNLPVSNDSWDSEMICYPCIFEYKDNTYMLYNGNGYGRTGFGLAILE